MAVLTCAEMVERCIAGQESGWRHFITEYLPFASTLLDRHYPKLASRRDSLLREVLLRARDQDAGFLRDYRGRSEREFLVHLRDLVLRVLEEAGPAPPTPEISLEWDAFEGALAGFTALEKQAVWVHVLSPLAHNAAARELRADEATIQGILGRAQEALRTRCDRWSAGMLGQNRHSLIQAARACATEDCPDPKVFIRILDGQITWRDRQEAERHMASCWRCVDRMCLFREVFFLSRQTRPMPESEAEPYFRAIGIKPAQPPLWKRWLRIA